MDKIRQYLYYIIIAIVSMLVVGFIPFLGSSIGLSWNVPDTPAGWIVWGVSKGIVACLNVLLFHCFMEQGKLNIKNDPRFIEACELFMKNQRKEERPKSPGKWLGQQYGFKGISIFLMSILASIALSQAILTFDWVSLISYLFTIIMGIIFGILQMKKAEAYWTEEFLKWAKFITQKKEKEKDDRLQGEGISES